MTLRRLNLALLAAALALGCGDDDAQTFDGGSGPDAPNGEDAGDDPDAGGGGPIDAGPSTLDAQASLDAAPMITCSGAVDPALDCFAPELCDYPVDITLIPEDPPSALGGTLLDGVYVLTAEIIYTGEGGPAGTEPAGDEYVSVFNDGDMRATASIGGETFFGRFNFDTDGTVLTTTQFCPESLAPVTNLYTATPAALTLYDGSFAFVFTRTADAP